MEIQYFPGDIPKSEDWILYQSSVDFAYKKTAVKDLPLPTNPHNPQIIFQASPPSSPVLGQLWLDNFFGLWRFSESNWYSQWSNVSLQFSKLNNLYSTNYGGLSNNFQYEFSVLEFRGKGFSLEPLNLKIIDLFGTEILEPYPLYFNEGIIVEDLEISLNNYSEDSNSLELLIFNLESISEFNIEANLSFSYRKTISV